LRVHRNSPPPSIAGYNINIPLPPGTGFGGYQAAWDRVVVPALRAYKPDVIFVSSGFDCCFLGACRFRLALAAVSSHLFPPCRDRPAGPHDVDF